LLTAAFCVPCRSKFRRHNCTVIRDRAPLYLCTVTFGRRYISIYEDMKRKRAEWMPLARFMVECFIGRKLDGRKESVHHKNNDKTDDRIENLSVHSASEHMREHTTEQKQHPTWRNWIPHDVLCANCGQVAKRVGARTKYCSRRCSWRHHNRLAYKRRKEKNGDGKKEVPGVRDEVQAPGGLGGLLLPTMRPEGEATQVAEDGNP